jgi:transposase
MAEPVRARRLTDTVRDVIHAFNEKGLAALDPQWAGGRPRLISDGDIEVIVAAARTRPEKLGQPFTRRGLRELADYLAGLGRPVRIGRERLRQVLHARGISFQRTRTWKESRDPDRDAKLDRIEYVTSNYPDRCFASGQFGPLSIRPCHGTCRAPCKHPVRLRATYHRTHGIRYFHGCYGIGDDQLWGVTREHKGRAVLHAHQRVAGQPDRGSIRALAYLRHGHLRLPGPPRARPQAPGLPALAQRPRPPPDVLAAQRRERARIRSERQQRWGRPKPKAA